MAAPSDDAGEINLELAPEPRSVTEARHAVTGLARTVGAAHDAVALAVSEAVSNAVLHAFRGDETGTILVRARATATTLVVTVADDGVGMVPHLESPGLGLGASLISRLSREATFESSKEGTRVTMHFDSSGSRGEDD